MYLADYLYFTPNSGNVFRSAHAEVVIGVLVLVKFGRRFVHCLGELRVETVQERVQALQAFCFCSAKFLPTDLEGFA